MSELTNSELNKLFAEKIMNWHFHPKEAFANIDSYASLVGFWEDKGLLDKNFNDRRACFGNELPNFCESITDAWLGVEKMRGKGFEFELTTRTNETWDAEFYRVRYDDYGTTPHVYSIFEAREEDTAPKAIVLAALKAVDAI